MPYKNIVFVKLEKRLLNDHRWFSMSDKAQLLYIKLMLGCAETYNKLPANSQLLRQQLRITWKKKVFDSAIKEIEFNFPKFKKDGNFYSFEEFDTKTNYRREIPSNTQVTPKEGIDIDKDIDIDKEAGILWRNIYLKNAGIVELDFVNSLIKKHGNKKTKEILYTFKKMNFHSIHTMENALLEDGSIKPKTNGTEEGKIIEHRPA